VFPGSAHNSARRKKQSSQVFASRFVISPEGATIGALTLGLKGFVHQTVAISAKNVAAVATYGN